MNKIVAAITLFLVFGQGCYASQKDSASISVYANPASSRVSSSQPASYDGSAKQRSGVSFTRRAGYSWEARTWKYVSTGYDFLGRSQDQISAIENDDSPEIVWIDHEFQVGRQGKFALIDTEELSDPTKKKSVLLLMKQLNFLKEQEENKKK